MMIYDIIIIGAGPSGLTAAIYAQRMGKKSIIVNNGAPGGRMLNTHLIENYPGIDSISGGGLAMIMFNQATKFGTEFEFSKVINVKHSKITKLNTVYTDSEKEIIGRTVYISAGMEPKLLKLPRTKELFGNGISTCVICDGAFARNKPIAIIGGGNAAAEETLFAKTIASKVYIINNQASIKAEKVTVDKLMASENVEIINYSDIVEYIGVEKLEGIVIQNNKTNEKRNIVVAGIFLYIGNSPNIKFASSLDIRSDNGFIEVNQLTLETKVESIFAGGDVIDRSIKQITIATADGTIAALHAIKYIDSNF